MCFLWGESGPKEEENGETSRGGRDVFCCCCCCCYNGYDAIFPLLASMCGVFCGVPVSRCSTNGCVASLHTCLSRAAVVTVWYPLWGTDLPYICLLLKIGIPLLSQLSEVPVHMIMLSTLCPCLLCCILYRFVHACWPTMLWVICVVH